MPTLALKSPNRIFMWYLENLSNTHHQFYLPLEHERSEQ
jgi:hypothetical protein